MTWVSIHPAPVPNPFPDDKTFSSRCGILPSRTGFSQWENWSWTFCSFSQTLTLPQPRQSNITIKIAHYYGNGLRTVNSTCNIDKHNMTYHGKRFNWINLNFNLGLGDQEAPRPELRCSQVSGWVHLSGGWQVRFRFKTSFVSWIWVIEILVDYRCNRCSGYLMPMLPSLCWCYDRQQKITKNIQVRHEQDDRRQPCCCLWSQSCLEQRQNHGQSSFSMRFNNLISILKIKPSIWLFRSVSVMII